MAALARIVVRLTEDAFRWVVLLFRSPEALRAENLFLRRQLALYLERGVKPRRIDAGTRISLALLSKLFDWRGASVVVQPDHDPLASCGLETVWRCEVATWATYDS